MVKNSILFYLFLLAVIVLTSVISFGYGMLVWYGISLIGNSIIIKKALTKKPDHKRILILISSLLSYCQYFAGYLFYLR